ncbi:MAG TPA: hypothetical protein PKZ78_09650, partial [Candidatus Goldiibacteriota bacterium]|nr:hypothetical protein [Candidatus Goldiibacteriota bacterium]
PWTALCVFLFSCNKKAPSTPAAEPDGSTPDLAIAISVDSSITGLTFDGVCDRDWFKVNVTNGSDYIFRTFDVSQNPNDFEYTDTYMVLLTAAGKAALTTGDFADITSNAYAFNDDCFSNCGNDPAGGGTMSTINFSSDYTGAVYILVLPYECTEDLTGLKNAFNPEYSFEAIKEII